MYSQLLASSQCAVQVDDSNVLCIKLASGVTVDPVAIRDCDVPILRIDLLTASRRAAAAAAAAGGAGGGGGGSSLPPSPGTSGFLNCGGGGGGVGGMPWDITLNRIVPFIDGRRCVKQIAVEAEVGRVVVVSWLV